MNFCKKFIAVCFIVILAISTFSITAFASDTYGAYITPTTLGKSFSASWETSASIHIYIYNTSTEWDICAVKCGFNKFLVDEDYMNKCYSSLYTHYCTIRNSNGQTDDSDITSAGTYTNNKAEVKHTGSDVRYYAFSRN